MSHLNFAVKNMFAGDFLMCEERKFFYVASHQVIISFADIKTFSSLGVIHLL